MKLSDWTADEATRREMEAELLEQTKPLTPEQAVSKLTEAFPFLTDGSALARQNSDFLD